MAAWRESRVVPPDRALAAAMTARESILRYLPPEERERMAPVVDNALEQVERERDGLRYLTVLLYDVIETLGMTRSEVDALIYNTLPVGGAS